MLENPLDSLSILGNYTNKDVVISIILIFYTQLINFQNELQTKIFVAELDEFEFELSFWLLLMVVSRLQYLKLRIEFLKVLFQKSNVKREIWVSEAIAHITRCDCSSSTFVRFQ